MEIKYLFPKFLLVGIFNTIIGYFLLALFIFIGLNNYIAFSLAHIVGVYINFNTYSFLFKNKDKSKIVKFAVTYLVLFLNGNILIYFIDFYQFNIYIGTLFVVIFNTLLGFILNKKYVFSVDKTMSIK